MKHTTKKCPLCEKGNLSLVAGNSLGRAVFRFCFFRPIWIFYIISGATNKKYKCNICGKKFIKGAIDK